MWIHAFENVSVLSNWFGDSRAAAIKNNEERNNNSAKGIIIYSLGSL